MSMGAFERKTAELAAGNMDYYVAGSGDPVLFLHGAGGLRWSEPLHWLAEKYCVFIPVYPGFDGTGAVDGVDSMAGLAGLLAEFMRTEMGGGADVIGLSFGGWAAMWLAADHGDLVELLVLEAPAGFLQPGKGGLSKDREEMTRRNFLHPEKQLDADARTWEQTLANYEAAGVYAGGSSYDEALEARLGDIHSSTLLIHGTADGVIPAEACRHLKAGIPRTDLVFVWDAAHVTQVDQPERYFGLVSDFLERGEAFIVKRSEADLAEAS